MNNIEIIKDALVEHIKPYGVIDIIGVCENLQIPCDDELSPWNNEDAYIKSGLDRMSDREIMEVVKTIVSEKDCPELLEQIDRCLEVELFEITTVTRRKILNWISERNDLEGELHLIKFLNRIWDLKNMPSIYREASREADIFRHMVRNDDLTYKELLEDVLKVIYVSDSTFKRFVEELVFPDVRSTEIQKEYVELLNGFLKSDGYSLLCSNYISGNPVYTLQKNVRGVGNEVKNIIFAGIGGKPDIVLDDSLSNTIHLVDNGVDCLVYNQIIPSDGLKWNELVMWWSNKDEYDETDADKLFERLIKSMDSNPEKNFMWVYYQHFIKEKNNSNLPALIPQVYCHYDPKSALMRQGTVYVHQRMDFLMLFSDKERVVIEIDGIQHYSEERELELFVDKKAEKVKKNLAIPKKYAEMVEDDRKLKLYGYNVFRFGGYEFMKEQRPKKKIILFFSKLFELYGVTV